MTSSQEQKDRETLITVCNAVSTTGLSFGTSGNASVRCDDASCLITPTGLSYEHMLPEDIVTLCFDGRYYGRNRPSSEWRFHTDIYQARPDVGAIVHTHSPFATALACRGEDIPAFHYMVAVAGGPDIRCAPYATFGTEELSQYAVTALQDRSACLLANHGQIALGATIADAFKLAGEVENLAAQYWRACQGGSPNVLDNAEMTRVLKKFETYGSNESSDPDLTSAGETSDS